MDINQRVNLIVENLSASKTAFSQATGISTVILSHISSGRNKVSLSACESILKTYPTINAEWLVLGVGSMYKIGHTSSEIERLKNLVTRLEEEVSRYQISLTHKIRSIKEEIDNLS
ncbi:hypothetical protein N9811_03235 [Bacteroidia bacterium]|nr:hypothetical protein [Bacteroidia bacterium]